MLIDGLFSFIIIILEIIGVFTITLLIQGLVYWLTGVSIYNKIMEG